MMNLLKNPLVVNSLVLLAVTSLLLHGLVPALPSVALLIEGALHWQTALVAGLGIAALHNLVSLLLNMMK